MNFLMNGLENRVGYDLNGDGYIGGEGWQSKLERKTHFDFNGDNIIGRPYDVPYYNQSMYGGGYGGYGGYPSLGGYTGGNPSFGGYGGGYGGTYPSMSYGHHHHHHY